MQHLGISSLGWTLTDNAFLDSVDQRELRKDDATDIATDEESQEIGCQCLIHTHHRAKDKNEDRHDLDYKFNGEYR